MLIPRVTLINLGANKGAVAGKLVRDRIPDIIRAQGRRPVFHTASSDDYRLFLAEKLKEEASEFADNPSKDELTDILEVIDAICEEHGFSHADVLETKREKAGKRGGFRDKIILDRIE